MITFIQIVRSFMFISIAVFFAFATVQLNKAPLYVSSKIDPLLERVKQRDDQIKSILGNVDDTIKENYWDAKANIETTAVILRDVSEIARTIRSEVLPETMGTLSEFRLLINEIKNDVQLLSTSGNEAVEETAELVRRLASLTSELETQIKQGSPKVFQTIESIDKVIVDVDRQINNPDLYAITNNVKDITGNTAEITKTVDITTRPLREKVKLVKLILLRLIGMIRIQPF